jgi:hypothetical protein
MSKVLITNNLTGATEEVEMQGISPEDISETVPTPTAEEQIEEMARQLVLAQDALDFLIMGGM